MPVARVLHGDCRDVLVDLLFEGFQADAVVCDPPYHLTSIVKRFGSPAAAPAKYGKDGAFARASRGFMGKVWDGGDIAADPETWKRVYEVMKPGAHLFAFGGTRTYHRMTCAIEDAGFEIRDCIMWMYASGFPKSHNVALSIDKAARGVPHGGADPSSPHHGKYKGGCSTENPNGRGFGAGPGAFMQEASAGKQTISDPTALRWQGWGTALKPACEPIVLARKPLIGTVAENVLAHGTGGLNIDACRVPVSPDVDARDVGRAITRNVRGQDDGYGMNASEAEKGVTVIRPEGRWPANVIHDGSPEVEAAFPVAPGQQGDLVGQIRPRPTKHTFGATGPPSDCMKRGDIGSAARFFYCAKANAEDRAGSRHPTVKPLALMAYLCKLGCPPDGTILDPFAGSGTTGEAAILEGFNAVLIEKEAEYITDIRRRLDRVKEWM